jgi:hypothetical protein
MDDKIGFIRVEFQQILSVRSFTEINYNCRGGKSIETLENKRGPSLREFFDSG